MFGFIFNKLLVLQSTNKKDLATEVRKLHAEGEKVINGNMIEIAVYNIKTFDPSNPEKRKGLRRVVIDKLLSYE